MMKLDRIVPFGRSYQEYELMFNLTLEDKNKIILGCGDGPASFNAEMTKLGYQVISIDPIYQFSGIDIKQRFDRVIDDIINQINASPEDWVWTYHQNSEQLRHNRIQVMKTFLADYENGRKQGRYQVALLPNLPFKENEFELALCSHLLFLYSDLLSFDFHWQSVQELCRVAQEVRIFPLLNLNLNISPHLENIQKEIAKIGLTSKIITVDYQLQKGGNQMLAIFRKN